MTIALIACYALFAATVAAGVTVLRRAVDLKSFLVFLALPAIFLFPGFTGDRTPIPADHLRTQFVPWNSAPHPFPYNPSLSDVATQFAPWAKTVRTAYKQGSVPFWDRWNGCGMPLAANGQSAPFSPFIVLMLALPLARAFVLLGAIKLFLALCGSYLWLTELRASRAADTWRDQGMKSDPVRTLSPRTSALLRSAVLISSVVNDGGWSARDGEGQVIPVVLANGPFLALVLPAGARIVTLTYRPPGLYGAALGSLASFILVAACLLWQRRASLP